MKLPALLACMALVVMGSPAAFAQEEKKSFPPLLMLWPDGAPGAKGPLPAEVKDAKLDLAAWPTLRKAFNDPKLADVAGIVVFLPPPEKANGAAVVICPGGGYAHLAADHEGEDIARWLNSLGVAGIVLKYRLGPRYHYPTHLHDAQRALRVVRSRAKDWKIDPKKVGILGFSAGGHLASTAATQFDLGHKDAKDASDRESCRPDFAILLYPVIRMDGPYSHGGSRTNLLGKTPAPEVVDSLNNDKQVTPKTPPTFLVHTTEDKAVPPENSALFYMALRQHGVAAELHIYEKGAHGLGLGPADLPYSSWPQRCAAWLTQHGILPPPPKAVP
jgi:acetyl esterase/lipase